MLRGAIGAIKIEGATGGSKISDVCLLTPLSYNGVLAPKQAQNARVVKVAYDLHVQGESWTAVAASGGPSGSLGGSWKPAGSPRPNTLETKCFFHSLESRTEA